MRALILTVILLMAGCSKEKNPVQPGPDIPQTPGTGPDTVDLPSALSRPLVMIPIPAGVFQMGSLLASDEQPVHSVALSAFRMAATDVTQELYQSVMLGVNPSYFKGDTSRTRPVEHVTWFDAVLFCNALSKVTGRDTVYTYTAVTGTPGDGCTDLAGISCDTSKNGYRLPTEAEWEYACRAGSTADYYWGGSYPPATHADTAAMDSNAAWYHNSTMTRPVGEKKPNAWGLYDMSGNVWQWCNDWYAYSYPGTAQTNPMGPAVGSLRVSRGGSYYIYGDANSPRSSCRGSMNPDARYQSTNVTGFRVARRP